MARDTDRNVAPWLALLICSLAVAPGDAAGQCDDDRLEPPGTAIDGKTVADWTAVMWQWLAAIPGDGGHPLFDVDGSSCAREQKEAVFFLPGSLIALAVDGQPLLRERFVVPCGKPILLAMAWALMWAPGDCDPGRMQDCRALAGSLVDTVTSLEATLDGTPLPCAIDRRELSPVFEFLLPSPPVENIFGLGEPLLRQGVTDGHWFLLKPLPPGRHDIIVRLVAGGRETPIHYGITVEPCDGASFRRGDADGDHSVSLTDAVATLRHLFQGGDVLPCADAADADDSGVVDLGDGVHTLNHLFRGGPAPPAPGPDECGADPTGDDELGCRTGC